MSDKSIVIATPSAFKLEPQTHPVTRSWVLSGNPVTRTLNVVRSRDWTSNIVVWECSAGRFRWHYVKDEALVVISGEAFISEGNGEERRLGPGDLAFFPAGASCVWRVPEGIKKVAILRETMWRPIGFCLKVWKKLLRMAGVGGESPL